MSVTNAAPLQKCGESISVGDDFGDNPATFLCEKPFGHTGGHLEHWVVEGKRDIVVTLKWHEVGRKKRRP